MKLTGKEFAELFEAWRAAMAENKEYLIELDQAAGDGDLGLSMTDGFTAISAYIREHPQQEDVGALFYGAGKAMNAHASSSLGTLIASGFMEAGKAFKGRAAMSGGELGAFLDSFEQGVIKRGKAKVGEKTFLDGFDPAVRIMKCAAEEDLAEAMERARTAARNGSNGTVGMLACWGRAARRGEESRALLDPGSVVAALMIETLADYVCGQAQG